jgi:hypothetical protein
MAAAMEPCDAFGGDRPGAMFPPWRHRATACINWPSSHIGDRGSAGRTPILYWLPRFARIRRLAGLESAADL